MCICAGRFVFIIYLLPKHVVTKHKQNSAFTQKDTLSLRSLNIDLKLPIMDIVSNIKTAVVMAHGLMLHLQKHCTAI